MKIIIGLGNPGKEYEGTRHNVGFDFLNMLIKHPRVNTIGRELIFKLNKKFQAEIAETQIAGDKYIFVKPRSFMNLSGKAVSQIVKFYKADIDDLLVICDDLDLPLGMSRIRLSGSSGGQKGLESIVKALGSNQIARLRIGIADHKIGTAQIEHPYERPEAKVFVLGKFSSREKPVIEKMIAKVVDIIVDCLTGKKELTATTFEV